MYCKEILENGKFSNCLNGDRFFYVEGTINPPLPKQHIVSNNVFFMFYNGQTIMCTKCKVSGHHSDSTQCSLYKDNTSVEDNTEITKVNDDFVCQLPSSDSLPNSKKNKKFEKRKETTKKTDFEKETEQLLLRTALTNYGRFYNQRSNSLSAMDDDENYNS